jgi:hypothetical protein
MPPKAKEDGVEEPLPGDFVVGGEQRVGRYIVFFEFFSVDRVMSVALVFVSSGVLFGRDFAMQAGRARQAGFDLFLQNAEF